jgi:hypothetical protein
VAAVVVAAQQTQLQPLELTVLAGKVTVAGMVVTLRVIMIIAAVAVAALELLVLGVMLLLRMDQEVQAYSPL